MGGQQRRPPGLALPTFSWYGLVSVVVVVVVVVVAYLAFLPLPPFPPCPFPFPFSFPPFPFRTSPSSSLSTLSTFGFFLAFAAPASADDVARFLEMVGERLRPLRVAAAVERVWCMFEWGMGLSVGGGGDGGG